LCLMAICYSKSAFNCNTLGLCIGLVDFLSDWAVLAASS
jgi:hypothetical protein